RARQAQLVRTLEEYLRQRGNVSATAQALYVHPNTLRQRLRRITELTELDVRTDDWLMIEIALKLLRLEDLFGVGERVATGSS
ncbi:MAG: helix-turn-helix domain-containing protein, partial [Gaiellales bacterium]